MSNYFKNFPLTSHDLQQIGKPRSVTNILRRFKFRDDAQGRIGTYYDYEVQPGDRPDTIAAKYYGSSSYAWVILHYNNIIDPVFDWPLFNNDFAEYLKGKYGSIASAQSTHHEYRKVLTAKTVKSDGTIIPERYVVVDQTTYNAAEDQDVSKYDWEIEQNDAKRKIKIMDKKYLKQITSEVESILRKGL